MKRVFWSFSNNQFSNATKNSFRKAYKMSRAHDTNLHQKTIDDPTDPNWAEMYAIYHPLHLALVAAYTSWKAGGGSLSGQTKALYDLLALLPKMIDQWMSLILPVYNRTSAKFKSFFPLGHKPFTKGAIEERIVAIQTLSTTIGDDTALIAAKTMIDADHLTVVTARNLQGGGKSSKISLKDTLETARVAAMDMLYCDTGKLIVKYFKTPLNIEPLFDLQTLRETMQSVFTRKMKTTETSEITKNTFVIGDELRGKVSDAGNLIDKVILYLASTPGGIDSTGVPFMRLMYQSLWST